MDKLSYALGMSIGQNLSRMPGSQDINFDDFLNGVKSMFRDEDPLISPEEGNKILEVVGIVFISKGDRTFRTRSDRHVVNVGHKIVADVLGVELGILTPIRIEANHFVSSSLGHCSAHSESQCNNFKVHFDYL